MYYKFKIGDKALFTRVSPFMTIWDHDGPPALAKVVCFLGIVKDIDNDRGECYLELVNSTEENWFWTDEPCETVWESELVPIPLTASQNQIKAMMGLLKINNE